MNQTEILEIIRGSFGKYMMITTPLVALFTDWSEVRRLPLLIVAGSITLLSSILVVDRQVDAQTSQTATGHGEDSSDVKGSRSRSQGQN